MKASGCGRCAASWLDCADVLVCFTIFPYVTHTHLQVLFYLFYIWANAEQQTLEGEDRHFRHDGGGQAAAGSPMTVSTITRPEEDTVLCIWRPVWGEFHLVHTFVFHTNWCSDHNKQKCDSQWGDAHGCSGHIGEVVSTSLTFRKESRSKVKETWTLVSGKGNYTQI